MIISLWNYILYEKLLGFAPRWYSNFQWCGSRLVKSGSGASILSESGSRALRTWNWKKKYNLNFFFLNENYLSLGLLKNLITSKLQEKHSVLKIEHPALQKMNFINSLLFLRFIFALLDPGTPLNPNPNSIRIRIHSTGNFFLWWSVPYPVICVPWNLYYNYVYRTTSPDLMVVIYLWFQTQWLLKNKNICNNEQL